MANGTRNINKTSNKEVKNTVKKSTAADTNKARKPAAKSSSKAFPSTKMKGFKDLDPKTQKELKETLAKSGINIEDYDEIGVTVLDKKASKKGSFGPVCAIALGNFLSAVKQRIADLIEQRNLSLSIIPIINKELIITFKNSDRLLGKIAYATSVFGNFTSEGGYMQDYDYSRLHNVFEATHGFNIDPAHEDNFTKRDQQMASYVDGLAKAVIHNAIVKAVDDGIQNITEKDIDKTYVTFFDKVQHAKIGLFKAAHEHIIKICKDRFETVFANSTLSKEDKESGLKVITDKVQALLLNEIDEDSTYSLIRKYMKDEKDSSIILTIGNRAVDIFNDIIDFCVSNTGFSFKNFGEHNGIDD